MIGLVAGLPLSVPTPARTTRKPDPVEALWVGAVVARRM